jgi:hypothetical protein
LEVPVRLARLAGRRRALAAAAMVVAVASPLAGCGITHVQDLNFRVDTRLHFDTPKDRSKVHLPLTISWQIKDFRIAAKGSEPPSDGAGYFAVFVDRQPIHPEQTMKAVADDRFCRRDPKCPDDAYLHDRQIYTTTSTTLRFDQIANLSSHDTLQLHTFVVVLMNTAGHRIGESAWELDLRIPKVGLS